MDSRQTVADEFCLMEPLVSTNEPIDDDADDVIAESGISIGMRCLSMAGTSVGPAPDTPVPQPPGSCSSFLCNNDNDHHNNSGNIGNQNNGTAVLGVTLDDDGEWGPPVSTGSSRRQQLAGRQTGASPVSIGAMPSREVEGVGRDSSGGGGSPPWGTSARSLPEDGAEDEGVDNDALLGLPAVRFELMGCVDGGGDGAAGEGAAMGAGANGAAAGGVPATGTILSARRKRTSGINREMGLGTAAGRFGRGARRRAGPGNGRGGLSRKTLNIVTNLESHTVGVRSKQELEEVEEEKRLAEEERRLKESLRQKGDDFDQTIRILLLGDSGVGKTSLMLRFSEDKFAPTMISTAGVDFKVQTLDIRGKRIRCQIWDTAGQEKFHVITRAYYRGAHGIALAYDVTDEDSFKNVNYWMANIQTHSDPAERIQKMILGNKVDIDVRQRAISSKDGTDVAKEFGVNFFEVSAKSGHGVSDAFYSLAVDIVQAVEASQKRVDDERRGTRVFGSGRLRSLANRKTSFNLSRRTLGVLKGTGSIGGGGSSGGGGGGGISSISSGGDGGGGSGGIIGGGRMGSGGIGARDRYETGEDGGEEGRLRMGMGRSASERCKVS